MSAATNKAPKQVPARKERSTEIRAHAPQRQNVQPAYYDDHVPAAGAHAAAHLVNEEATPGAGALPSYMHKSGKEVDGAAG